MSILNLRYSLTFTRHRVTAYPATDLTGPQCGIERQLSALCSSTVVSVTLAWTICLGCFQYFVSSTAAILYDVSGRTYLIKNNIQRTTFRRLLLSQFSDKNEDETYGTRQKISPKRLRSRVQKFPA